MDDERDVEVFERIPWESLEQSGDRRWMMYLIAGVVALGAVGVSLGRQMGTASEPVTGVTAATSTDSSNTAPPPPTTETTITPTSVHSWSEADLMALPVGSIENGALARAEWYIVDFLTRDDPEDDRSFVEWARGTGLEWRDAETAIATVAVRRLGATEGEAYQRLEAEGWAVELELNGDTWRVVGPPAPVEAPLPPVETREPTTEWVDGAGVSWQVGDVAAGDD